jgi:arylsulfatase A-like enzyme
MSTIRALLLLAAALSMAPHLFAKEREAPNVLMVVTDEEIRIPWDWEGPLKPWYQEHMPAYTWFEKYGIEFTNHHVFATACTPSRVSMFTGLSSGLTGVYKTDGFATGKHSPEMTWLKLVNGRSQWPTIGHWLMGAGFDQDNVVFSGKFHLAISDILDTEGQTLFSVDESGQFIQENVDYYRDHPPLIPFGFSNRFTGPEPHGALPINSGNNRDPGYIAQTIEFLNLASEAYKNGDVRPWFYILSLVNPHDIVLAIGLWMHNLVTIDETVPYLPPMSEDQFASMSDEPPVQEEYRRIYRLMYGDDDIIEKFYTEEKTRDWIVRFYYTLLKKVDNQVMEVLTALEQTPFFNKTIVMRTADHGDLLGEFGWQKWHTLRSRVTHVPFFVVHPAMASLPLEQRKVNMLTSHIDLVPTIMGLFNVRESEVAPILARDFANIPKLPGQDLSPIIRGEMPANMERAIFLETKDDISRGENNIAALSRQQPFDVLNEKGESVHWIQQSTFPSITGERFIEGIRLFEDNKQWFFTRHFDPDKNDIGTFRLYNKSAEDPGEVKDIAHLHKDRVTRFQQKLDELRNHYHVFKPLVVPARL